MRRDCPDEETIACFIENRLPEGERREIEIHLEECKWCKEIVWLTEKVWAKERNGEILEVPEDLIKKAKNLLR
jgi:hypothetical protein